MPQGPQGQKRPHGTVEAAVMVAKLATGEIEEELTEPQGSVLADYLKAEEEAQESSEAALVEGEPCLVYSK